MDKMLHMDPYFYFFLLRLVVIFLTDKCRGKLITNFFCLLKLEYWNDLKFSIYESPQYSFKFSLGKTNGLESRHSLVVIVKLWSS